MPAAQLARRWSSQMFAPRLVVRFVAFAAAFGSVVLLGQSKPAQRKPQAPTTSIPQEFPVTMRQNVVAGKTLVGTKVEAKLTLATLVDRVVIPEGAIFSGEVVESAARSATNPSRLTIRMDSVRWKQGSAPIKVYLTAWYYPSRMLINDGNDAPDSALHRNRSGTYSPNSPAAQPYPGYPGQGGDSPRGPSSNISENRVVMKNVESAHQSGGALGLTSTHFNIKLDKSITYVLATCELTAVK